MMSIATAACAFCMAQSANATEVSATAGASATVNSSAPSSTAGSNAVTSSTATSNTTNGGGSAFAKGSAKEVKTAEPKNTAEQGKTADSATTVQSTAIYAATTSVASNQSQTITQQNAQSNSPASNNTTTDQDDMTWTRDDFNITPDGKQIGYRKDITVPAHDGKPASTENVIVPGLNEKGLTKLNKNPHLVIPEGIQVINECAFIGHAKQVGSEHEHIDGETYIEGITLPDSLKVIEDGAFSWQKIKGTVVIPKNVIAIHPTAFLGNEIEKVVFKSTLSETGKFNSTDDHAYYVAGLGNRAFQANKIKEIDFQGNLTDYKFRVDSNEKQKPAAAPFSNQDLGKITVEVGEIYKTPIKITQENASQVNAMEGFFQSGYPVLIGSSSNFQKNDKGEYVAKTPGTLDGLVMLYDLMSGDNRNIGSARFTYEILPKGSLCTVTFNNEHTVIAKVRVKKGQTITNGVVNNGQMPANPTKASFTFMGWNTAADGSGTAFSADTTVTEDLNVYAYFKNFEPALVVKNASITEGDSLDLNSLVVSATDKEDGDLKSSVQLTDNGGFDNTKVGSYKITFSVTDKGGKTATAAATVTVTKKPTPPTPPAPTPEPEPEPAPTPEPEPDIDWDDIPDIDLTPNQEPEPIPTPVPVPDFPVPVAPAPILPPAEAEPELAPAPSQPEPEPKHAAKHLPKTGSTATPILASAIASLFAGFAGLAESFAANRKRRN